MGAWGELDFDNDTANDWADDLEGGTDLSLVHAAIAAVEDAGSQYLDQDTTCNALAACEVLARLGGDYGYRNAYTEKVDAWVGANPQTPPPALLSRAVGAIDRILGGSSELRELWDDAGDADWTKAMADLRVRVGG